MNPTLAPWHAIHAGIAWRCNDSSDGNRVPVDYFVVRLQSGFGERTKSMYADPASTLVARPAPIHIKRMKHEKNPLNKGI